MQTLFRQILWMLDAIPDRPILTQYAIRSKDAFDEVLSDSRTLFDRHVDRRFLLGLGFSWFSVKVDLNRG